MIASFINIFRIPDLRRKVLITLGLFLVYRIGAHVPTPFINADKITEYLQTQTRGQGAGVFAVVDLFSGGAFRRMTIFALGIMPYISASIVLQLLQVIWPRVEKIAKEGEAGRKKINQWTRYGTVLLSLFQGFGLGIFLYRSGLSTLPTRPLLFTLTTAITMSAGTCFIMWLGEKISEHGIGNGISLIIAIGILAAYPFYISEGYTQAYIKSIPWLSFIFVLVVTILTAALIVLSQEASRKIPVQHARPVAGRKMQGGTTYIPLKLNSAGVIPVIFSSALLSFPALLQGMMPQGLGFWVSDWFYQYSNHNIYNLFNLQQGGVFSLLKVINFYTLAFTLLTVFFCYFYTAITFNPVELADNLKKSGAFIPGRKPGKPTSDFINHILVRITVVGAAVLIVVSLIPNVLIAGFNIPFNFAQIAGGTGLIIVVGVILDTMKQIEAQLMMRHYEGFEYRGTGMSGRRRLRR